MLGGSKVSDKLEVLDNLLGRVDSLVVGGGMCFTFLAAQGHEIGDSLFEPDQVDAVKALLARAERDGKPVLLPTDVVVAREVSEDAETRTVPASGIEAGWKGLDIGPDTAKAFAAAPSATPAPFWNGPMGVFELAPFAAGTKAVAEAVAAADGYTVVGGATRPPPWPSSAWPTRSTTCPPAAGPASSCSRGKTLPGVAAVPSA